MTKKPTLPLPGPPDPDFEAPPPPKWMEEMEWASKGQYAPLANSLRTGKRLDPDNWYVREFLADYLTGKIKRSRKRPPHYSDWTWAVIGPKGEIAIVKREYADVCEAAAFFWQQKREAQSSGMTESNAYANALTSTKKQFLRLKNSKAQKQLETWLGRSTNQRRKLAARK